LRAVFFAARQNAQFNAKDARDAHAHDNFVWMLDLWIGQTPILKPLEIIDVFIGKVRVEMLQPVKAMTMPMRLVSKS